MADAAEARVRALLAAAGQARASGRSQDADRLLEQLEREAPSHPITLNELAQKCLTVGDLTRAKALLERAVKADPMLPILWVNLATALHGLNRTEEEKLALDKALAIDPRNLRALLHAGGLQESQGETRAAAATYRRALESVPRGANLPPAIQAHLQHAQTVVTANNADLERFLEDRLKVLRTRYGNQSTRRFDKCMATLLQKQPIYRPQPTFMYFPELPALEFYDRALFPWLDEIEAATDDIRAEFLDVFAEDSDSLEPYVHGRTPNDIFWGLNESQRWSVYYLWREGRECPDNLARCPKTAEALKVWPKCELRGSGPSAVFSILDAKTTIPPHNGVHNSRLIVHLPLIVPEDCWFQVGAARREWEPGKAFVFDDSIEHQACNGSDRPRTVMIFDIWNPFVDQAERELVTALTDGVGEFYGTLPAYV